MILFSDTSVLVLSTRLDHRAACSIWDRAGRPNKPHPDRLGLASRFGGLLNLEQVIDADIVGLNFRAVRQHD
jgi:hypothetical protein